jgi:tetratricopeptide (TPR) repeat protein
MAHEHIVYMMLTDAAAQLGDGDAIDRYATLLEPLVDKDVHRPYQAVAHRGRGIAYRLRGDFNKAGDHLSKALQIFQDMDAAWQLGRTHCALAQLEIDRSNHKGAYDQYLQALEKFERVQALPEMKRTRAALEGVELAE